MPTVSPGEVTTLLRQIVKEGDSHWDRLFGLVYEDLRSLAGSYFRSQASDHTLQPTAVVHEAYIKLVDRTRVDFKDRSHFFAVGALAMRQILVNHAKAKGAQKRGSGARKMQLDEAAVFLPQREEDVLAIDEVLVELAELHERHAKIVELRFFGGLSIKETAQVLQLSERTVDRDWRTCRAWLRTRFGASK